MVTTTTQGPGYKRLSQLRDRVPGVHVATLTRWIGRGVKTASGETVRLQAVRIGSRWYSTAEWLDAFIQATTAASMPAATPNAPVILSPAQKKKHEAATDRRLDELLR